MAKQIAQIDPVGGSPELEIQFGEANIGVYRVFRWDSNGNPAHLAVDAAGKVPLGPAAELPGATISYETIIQSPKSAPDQRYSLTVLIQQDGRVVSISERGKLNPDGATSFIGFITFQRL